MKFTLAIVLYNKYNYFHRSGGFFRVCRRWSSLAPYNRCVVLVALHSRCGLFMAFDGYHTILLIKMQHFLNFYVKFDEVYVKYHKALIIVDINLRINYD